MIKKLLTILAMTLASVIFADEFDTLSYSNLELTDNAEAIASIEVPVIEIPVVEISDISLYDLSIEDIYRQYILVLTTGTVSSLLDYSIDFSILLNGAYLGYDINTTNINTTNINTTNINLTNINAITAVSEPWDIIWAIMGPRMEYETLKYELFGDRVYVPDNMTYFGYKWICLQEEQNEQGFTDYIRKQWLELFKEMKPYYQNK